MLYLYRIIVGSDYMKVFISCSSSDNVPDKYKEQAKEVANYLASTGYDLLFGSSNKGLMGIVYREFYSLKRKIYTVVPQTLIGNLTEVEADDIITVDNVLLQPSTLVEESDLIVVLPGGIGTMSELAIALFNNKLLNSKKIIIYNIDNFFDDCLNFFSKMEKNNCVIKSDFNDFMVVENINELKNIIK